MTGLLKARFDPVFAWPNTYILWSAQQAIVIDPGRGSRPWIDEVLTRHDLTVAVVLLTHSHMDHSWEAQPLADAHQTPVVLARSGWPYLLQPEKAIPPNFPAQHLRGYPRQLPANLQAPNQRLRVDDITIDPIETPGHSTCSTSYAISTPSGSYLATGDTLFAHAIAGEAIEPTGEREALQASIDVLQAHLAAHPDTQLLPGHG